MKEELPPVGLILYYRKQRPELKDLLALREAIIHELASHPATLFAFIPGKNALRLVLLPGPRPLRLTLLQRQIKARAMKALFSPLPIFLPTYSIFHPTREEAEKLHTYSMQIKEELQYLRAREEEVRNL